MTLVWILIIFCTLLVAFILDGHIRKKIYVADVALARLDAKKELGVKSQAFETIMNDSWKGLSHMNNFRYGIIGELDYDIKPNDEYSGSGEQTFIGTGVVLDRKFISRKDVVDDMASFAQTGKKFVADPKELRDRYIIVMYLQSTMNQFVWEDKELYENVEKGEKVCISYNEKGPLYVGYKLKGEQRGRGNNTKPKNMDMGGNKNLA